MRLKHFAVVSLLAVSVVAGTLGELSAGADAASTYVVRSGDSLSAIASRLDVALGELLRVNNLTITSTIHPGQHLLVPGPGSGGSTGGRSAGATTYVVRSGDGLGRIAQRHGVTLNALLRANNLTAASLIVPGQVLLIPPGGTGGGSTGGGAAGARTYVVRSGDGLGRIAQRHGVTLNALLRANNLTAASLIVPGQLLLIPAGGGGAGGGGSPNPGGGGSAGAAGTYVVRSGDFLGRIASSHSITLDALLAANRLTAKSLIVPGQVLIIPRRGSTPTTVPPAPPPTTQPPRPPATTPPPAASGVRYTVRPGDALGQIARLYNVELRALLAANAMSSNSLIVPGQVISLPTGARLRPIDRVLNFALAQVGKPWRFFSRGPDAFDCSGLTTAAFAQIGVALVHQSAAQARQGTAVDFRTQPILPGDLVFQDTDGDGIINHVGIALSDTMWVQARSGRMALAYGPIPPDDRIVTVRRVLPPG